MAQWRGNGPPCALQPGRREVVEVGQEGGREEGWAGGGAFFPSLLRFEAIDSFGYSHSRPAIVSISQGVGILIFHNTDDGSVGDKLAAEMKKPNMLSKISSTA